VHGGRDYFIVETVDEILEMSSDLKGLMLPLTSVTGQPLFPPERFFVRFEHIASLQEVSETAWTWSQRLQELGYARQMADLEHHPSERIAIAQERIANRLMDEDDE
jgi:hypothetical protein